MVFWAKPTIANPPTGIQVLEGVCVFCSVLHNQCQEQYLHTVGIQYVSVEQINMYPHLRLLKPCILFEMLQRLGDVSAWVKGPASRSSALEALPS